MQELAMRNLPGVPQIQIDTRGSHSGGIRTGGGWGAVHPSLAVKTTDSSWDESTFLHKCSR